jgi:hypothetical protein
VATLFVTHVTRFYHFYIVSLCIAIVNLVCLFLVFRLKTTDQLVGSDASWKGNPDRAEKKRMKKAEAEAEARRADGGQDGALRMVEPLDAVQGVEMMAHELVVAANGSSVEQEKTGTKMKQIFRDKRVYLLAFFLLCYVGTEVSLGVCGP